MKKRYIISATALALLGLTVSACSNQTRSTTSSAKSAKTVKKAKHKVSKRIKQNKKKSVAKKILRRIKKAKANQPKPQNKQANNQQNANSSQQQQLQRQLTQGEINRQRGYDPKGAPTLQGQDHAAGANPNGSPDAWVQGQIDWAKRNGYMNADGSYTQKEKDLDQQTQNDDYSSDIPQMPNPGE